MSDIYRDSPFQARVELTPDEMHRRMTEAFGDRTELMRWQLVWHARHPQVQFDVTFYDREPILNVTLDEAFARRQQAEPKGSRDLRRMQRLLDRPRFSDGTVARLSEIWTINYMPADLDVSGVNMAGAEKFAGLGGETIREMIRASYHCRSRAEEDHFIARWIAS